MFITTYYIARMSPTLSGSSALQRVKLGDVIEIRNGIIFDFYSGLPHMHLLNQLTSNFPKRQYYKVGKTAGAWDDHNRRTTLERLN